jgi:serine protease Do
MRVRALAVAAVGALWVFSGESAREPFTRVLSQAAPWGVAHAAPIQDLWKERGQGDPLPPGIVPMPSLAPLVSTLKPAVVNISTTQSARPTSRRGRGSMDDPLEEFYRRFREGVESPRKSLGSGFIISPKGYLISNNHVVEGASEIRVKLADGREFEAEPVGLDAKTDTALLKLKSSSGEIKDLPIVPLGNSDSLEVGEFVVAVGNPFGFDESVSLGIVSAKERVIGAGPYDEFIQTDAAINPGNSGGPLFNTRGEVVGVNTAIVAHGQGIGFAIPVNMVKALLPQLLEKGRATRGWLGVSIQEVTPELSRMLKLERTQGALIAGVMKAGPADAGGLRAGDLVVGVNGRKVDTYNQLMRYVAFIAPGTSTKLTVLREGKERNLEVTLGERPEDEDLVGRTEPRGAPSSDKLGLSVAPLSAARANRSGIDGGVQVTQVKADGPAARAGVQPGDVVVELQRQPIRTVGDYAGALASLRPGEMALLRLQRESASIYIAVRLPR